MDIFVNLQVFLPMKFGEKQDGFRLNSCYVFENLLRF
jgi:hypothetical protein